MLRYPPRRPSATGFARPPPIESSNGTGLYFREPCIFPAGLAFQISNRFMLALPSISHQGMDRFFRYPKVFTPIIWAEPALGRQLLPAPPAPFPLTPGLRHFQLHPSPLPIFSITKRAVFFASRPLHLQFSGPLSTSLLPSIQRIQPRRIIR